MKQTNRILILSLLTSVLLSCVSGKVTREDIEWSDFWWGHESNTSRPRVLFIGNSISKGYFPIVSDKLAGIANCDRYATSRSVEDPAYFKETKMAMAKYNHAVIYFNNGLHGWHLTNDQYQKGLEKYVKFLKANKTKGCVLVYSLTTPYPSTNPGQKLDPVKNQVVIDRNTIAAKIMEENGIPIIDLYGLMEPGLEKYSRSKGDVHYNDDGNEMMAELISKEIIRMKSDHSFSILKKLPKNLNPFSFHGFEGYDFTFRNRNAKIVVPKQVAVGHPWIWRARFWGHEPQTDIALLEKGFHVVYCDVAEMFGNKKSLSIWNEYYQLLIKSGLAKKAVMEGMSRGGVYIYRWAATYPERVSAIYADAPVLDLKSWPGGKGQSKGSPENWEIFKKDFDFKTDEEALAFKGNPINLTAKIVRAGIPMLHVVGDADDVVPVAENTMPFEQKIKAAGGSIQVIHKPGIGHHPHSLQNPQPIVDFILKATGLFNQ